MHTLAGGLCMACILMVNMLTDGVFQNADGNMLASFFAFVAAWSMINVVCEWGNIHTWCLRNAN